MRILIVANHNPEKYTTFITEQVESVKQLGVEVDYYGIHGKGIWGYLTNISALKEKIREYHPDLIHAHYGLSGLLANLQREVPVVTSYHGSDIHSGGRTLFFSKLAIKLSAYNIFVSKRLLEQSGYNGLRKCVISCGINMNTFLPIDRSIARKTLGWDPNGTYVFFGGAFDNKVKNSPLAKAAVAQIEGAQLMEMRGYTRNEVNLAMNAADCLLMTSHREGGPLVVKEAMACGTPVVAVRVGDVEEAMAGVEGCYVTSHDVNEVASCLRQALSFQGKTKGRQRIIELGLPMEQVAKQVKNIYNIVLKNDSDSYKHTVCSKRSSKRERMKVLIVGNDKPGQFSPFVMDQVSALKKLGVVFDFYGVSGKGVGGYLSNLFPLKEKIHEFHPDLIHAHYGLSGMLANLQRTVPVVTTYHGSDIHSGGLNLFISKIAMRYSAYNIFVSPGLLELSGYRGENRCIIPCGVDITTFIPMERIEARKHLGWDEYEKFVVFAGAFDNEVKNSPLAKKAVSLVPDAKLVELRGYAREQVNILINAANCLLMTSHREGSPVVIKEAMACGTPIVSVDVGDVKDVTSGVNGCFISTYNANDIAANIIQALLFNGKTNGPQCIREKGLSDDIQAEKILKIYQTVLESPKR